MLVVFAALSLWLLGGTGNTPQRVRSEHGIVIPKSSRNLRCEGLLNLSFLDTGTMATFEVPAADVEEISRQLFDQETVSDPGEIPAIGENRIPANFGEVSSGIRARSKEGNTIYLVVYKTDEAHRGICLKTLWN